MYTGFTVHAVGTQEMQRSSKAFRPDSAFRCIRYLGNTQLNAERLMREVLADDDKHEVATQHCHLGDLFSTRGGCQMAEVTHCKSVRVNFSLFSLATICHC